VISRPVRIRVWGPWACFTRPEFHVERVSYPVITPSAARGVLEAILMKPIEKPEADRRDHKIGFRWHVLRIGVVKKGTLTSILRNELGYASHNYEGYDIGDMKKVRTQRHSLILKGCERDQCQIEYLIDAAIEVPGSVKRIGDEFLVAKYQGMFERRAKAGQCHHRPYLGCREFPCDFEWAPNTEPPAGCEDFGMIFRDFDFDPMWEHWAAGARPSEWAREHGPQALQPLHAKSGADGWIMVSRIVEGNGRRKVVPA